MTCVSKVWGPKLLEFFVSKDGLMWNGYGKSCMEVHALINTDNTNSILDLCTSWLICLNKMFRHCFQYGCELNGNK